MKTWSIDADPDDPRIHYIAVTGATCIAASRRARLLGSGQRTLVRRARQAGSVGHRSSVAPFSVVAKCRKFWLIAAAILAPPSQGLPERSASRSILTSASHVATVFVAILAGISAARGQALQANGIVVDAPAGTYGPVTTPTNAQGGTAFNAVNGGTINATGFVTLLAAIDGARGVWTGPQGTGTVNLPFGAIVSTTGNGEAYGLQASGGGSQVTGTNVTVTNTGALNPATGFSPIGVLANGGGVVILNGGSVSTQGQGANGLRSTGVGSSLSATNFGVTTTAADAVLADSGGTISLVGNSTPAPMVTAGGGNGLLAFNGGSSITASGISILTTGQSNQGVFAFSSDGSGASVSLTNTSVNTTVNFAVALLAFGSGASVTANGGIFTTSGAGAPGAYAFANGLVTLAGTSITTTGPGSPGLVAGNGGVLRDTNSTVVSQSGDGAEVDNGSTLILNGTKLTGQNNGIVVTDSGGTGLVNIVSLNGANLTSRNFDGIVVTDALANITVANNSTILPGSGILVNATGASNVTLTVDSSSLTGALIAGGTSIADATFQNASHLTGTITNWRNLSVDTTSSWSVTGDSVLTGTVSNAGLIAFTSPSGSNFKTLTVGSYVGTGGTLGLNTFLGADGSPSDKLVINGGTADSSIMRITNAGGPGAETTGNGILVVKAINGGTTAAGAFTLPFGELRAGAFDYDLFRGGLNGSNPDDWFLRSGFTVGPVAPGLVPPGPVPPGPVPPGLGPGEPFPTDPPPNPLPPGLYPIIGPELATDGVVQPIARQLGLTTLGTLHERFGDSLEPCLNRPRCSSGCRPGSRPVADH